MDLLQALNFTIYGLGIIFLALLVLMVAIMVLGKLYSVATGRDILAVPAPASQAAPEPVATPAPAAAPAPAPAAAPAARTPTVAPRAPRPHGAAPGRRQRPPSLGAVERITAPLPGRVMAVPVQPGDSVKAGEEVCVIEAMKMGNSIKARRSGTVKEVLVSAGQTVGFGAPLITMAAVEVIEERERAQQAIVDAISAAAARRSSAPGPGAPSGRNGHPTPGFASPTAPTSAAGLAPASPPQLSARPTGERITAPLPGKVMSIAAQVGVRVDRGDELCVIEAMKMGNSIKARRAGTITGVLVSANQTVGFGAPLFVIE